MSFLDKFRKKKRQDSYRSTYGTNYPTQPDYVTPVVVASVLTSDQRDEVEKEIGDVEQPQAATVEPPVASSGAGYDHDYDEVDDRPTPEPDYNRDPEPSYDYSGSSDSSSGNFSDSGSSSDYGSSYDSGSSSSYDSGSSSDSGGGGFD